MHGRVVDPITDEGQDVDHVGDFRRTQFLADGDEADGVVEGIARFDMGARGRLFQHEAGGRLYRHVDAGSLRAVAIAIAGRIVDAVGLDVEGAATDAGLIADDHAISE